MAEHRSHTDCRKTWVPEQQPEEAFCGKTSSLRKEKSPTEGPVEAKTDLSYLGGEKKGHTLDWGGYGGSPFLLLSYLPLV